MELEHRERYAVPLATPRADDPERLAATVLPPEPDARGPVLSSVGQRDHPGQLVRTGKQAEGFAQPLELGRGLIAQQPGEGQVSHAYRPARTHETEPGRRRVAHCAELFLGVAERVFHPAAVHHLGLEVRDLFAEPGKLVAELLFGAVLVAHRA